MIIIKVIGGLGNQMFQYALGVNLARRTGLECKMDLTDFALYKLHKYSLDHFAVHLPVATLEEVRKFKTPALGILTDNALKKVGLPKIFSHRRYIAEKDLNFDPAILSTKDDSYLDGYWQSEKYFFDAQEQIHKDLHVLSAPDTANAAMLEKIRNTESVALHIRRGDYVTNQNANSFFGVLPIAYYHTAMKYIAERVVNPTFYVFSDDTAWAKENLGNDHAVVVADHNNADKNYEDIRLMSSCKHQIIANSSFSWWGAWLNPNPHKTVIAPQHWFQASGYNIHDRIPETWITL